MNCSSCKTLVTSESVFCHSCGEKINPGRLTLRSIFQRFLVEFLDYDNKFLKTFRLLFSKPEKVIDAYVYGQRKTYVNVLTYFSISLTLIAIQVFILKTFYPELLASYTRQSGLQMKEFQEIMSMAFDYQGLLTIILTPFSALISWLVFMDQRYNFAEHIVLNIYPSAQFYIVWFMATILIIAFEVDYQVAGFVSIGLLFLYMIYVFKRVFEIRWITAIGRSLVYYLIYIFFYSLIFLLLGIAIGIYLATKS